MEPSRSPLRNFGAMSMDICGDESKSWPSRNKRLCFQRRVMSGSPWTRAATSLSVLMTETTDSFLTHSCLSFQAPAWPEAILGSTSSPDPSMVLYSSTQDSRSALPRFLLLTFCQSLSQNLLCTPTQSPKQVTTPRVRLCEAATCFTLYLSIFPSRSCCCTQSTHWDILLFHFGPFVAAAVLGWWPDCTFIVNLQTSNLSAIFSPRKSQIPSPIALCLSGELAMPDQYD